MSSPAASRVAYCTIASANYLDKVQTLLESIERHSPGASCFVLLCEQPEVCARLSTETGVHFWSPAEVCARWREMAFYYNVVEFNTALKPFFLEKLLDQGYEAIVYLDPDIEVYGALDAIAAAARDNDVVLTPHVTAPIPDDGCKPSMDAYIRAGQFNLGFVAFAASKNARAMLDWWKDMCLERCLFEPDHRLFVDQFWAAAFASFAERACVLRDPGCNVAYWNLFQRPVTRDASGRWQAGGAPLTFFHFSGLEETDLTRVSRHQDRVEAPALSPLHDLLTAYATRVGSRPWHRYATTQYSFAAYASGELVTAVERRNYLYLGRDDRIAMGDPFTNRDAVKRIVRIELSKGPYVFVAHLRIERAWRVALALSREFRDKLRTRGPIGAARIALRYLLRALLRN